MIIFTKQVGVKNIAIRKKISNVIMHVNTVLKLYTFITYIFIYVLLMLI